MPSTLVERAIADVVSSFDAEEPSRLSGATALASTDLIFACWESTRRGQQSTLPLDIDDNPLGVMIEAVGSGEAERSAERFDDDVLASCRRI